MGRLIERDAFFDRVGRPTDRTRLLDPFWFFVDPDYPDFEKSYPCELTIHVDVLEGVYGDNSKIAAGKLRIEIRKFIERMMESDVIYHVKHLTHIRLYPKCEHKRERVETRIKHGYYHFRFEDLASATHFKMKFGEHCKPVEALHPGYPPQEGHDDFVHERDLHEFRMEQYRPKVTL